MKKIGICGHFNLGYEAVGGQTIKTRIISAALEDSYGAEQVQKADTANWKRKALILFFQCIHMALCSEHIIILPARKGVKLLLPLFVLLSKLLGKKLHFIIVGAWLPDFLDKHRYFIRLIKRIDYIYAQTNTLRNKLVNLGLSSNIYLMPNFKNSNPSFQEPSEQKYIKPYRVCIMSRINYKKGIESAIHVLDKINNEQKQRIVELDIYGPVEEQYKDRFDRLCNRYRQFVTYKGIVDYQNTAEVMKHYYLLLFPTKYYTEGFPGTILDAYLSGVPVLASRWESSSDVIREGKTGFTYEFNNNKDFYQKLKSLLRMEQLVQEMKKNCQAEAEKYKVEKVMKELLEHIEANPTQHKKKIGLLIPNLQSGGAEHVVSFTSQLLTEVGYDVTIFLFDAEQIEYPYQGKLVNLYCKSGNNTMQKGILRILRIIKLSYYKHKYDLDIVISFLYAANIVNYYSVGKAKKILSCRGYRDYLQHGKIYSKMLKNIKLILVQTQRMKLEFIKDFNAREAQIVEMINPINILEIRKRVLETIEEEIQAFIDTHIALCTIGSFKKDKGYWHLIRIFLEVKKAIPEAGLIFIGNRGEMEEDIKNMAAHSIAAEDILFIGYQDNPFKYVAKCDLFVCTSINEGLPNSMLEAMACGVPIISTDCKTGPREILCKMVQMSPREEILEVYGALVPELSDKIDLSIATIDSQELVMAKEIIDLLQDENRLMAYRTASLMRSEEFDFASYLTKLISIIEG